MRKRPSEHQTTPEGRLPGSEVIEPNREQRRRLRAGDVDRAVGSSELGDLVGGAGELGLDVRGEGGEAPLDEALQYSTKQYSTVQ